MPVMFGVKRHVCSRLSEAGGEAEAAEAAARGEPVAAALEAAGAGALYAPLLAAANYSVSLFYPTLELGPEEYATPWLAQPETVAARSGRLAAACRSSHAGAMLPPAAATASHCARYISRIIRCGTGRSLIPITGRVMRQGM